MLNRFSAAFCLALLCSSSPGEDVRAEDFVKRALPKNHPLVGTWRAELPELKCFEETEFRADGTRTGISGAEVLQADTIISNGPDSRGFYLWADKITAGNGKPDCFGGPTAEGEISQVFVKLSADGASFYQCRDEDGKVCMGPYVKQHGT